MKFHNRMHHRFRRLADQVRRLVTAIIITAIIYFFGAVAVGPQKTGLAMVGLIVIVVVLLTFYTFALGGPKNSRD